MWPGFVSRPSHSGTGTTASSELSRTSRIATRSRASCARESENGEVGRAYPPVDERTNDTAAGVLGEERDEGIRRDVPVPIRQRVRPQRGEEGLVSEREPNGVQGQRPAFVDPVVEHVSRTGIAHDEVLRQLIERIAVRVGVLIGGQAPALLLPEPIGVAGKALLQPNVP